MAKLGTPENPEILDPVGDGERFNAQPRPEAPRPTIGWRARLKLSRQLLFALLSATLPALFMDLILISLAQAAWAGSVLAGVGSILLFVPALIFSLIALAAILFLVPVICMTLFGKRLTTINQFGGGTFKTRVFKFGDFGSVFENAQSARDVSQASPLINGDERK